MRVLIVGAGIAGLTLAGLLRQRGIAADIVERAPDIERAGYVLGLYPLGSRILYGLGVHRSFVARSEPLETYTVAGGNGRVIKSFDFQPLNEKFGEVRMLARGELLRLLARAAGDCRIRSGYRSRPATATSRTTISWSGRTAYIRKSASLFRRPRKLSIRNGPARRFGWNTPRLPTAACSSNGARAASPASIPPLARSV